MAPKPLQKPHPPLWVAARHPTTYDWALPLGCNIMSWALTRPFGEVVKYKPIGADPDGVKSARGMRVMQFMNWQSGNTTGKVNYSFPTYWQRSTFRNH